MSTPAKNRPAPKTPSEVQLTYETPAGTKTVEVHLPLAHGRGEHILNHAEKEGCTDIEALREDIKNLPTA